MLKLKGVTFEAAPKMTGVRSGPLGEINLSNEQLRGWQIIVKGAMVVFVSPKGWKSGKLPREWDRENGPVTVHESPRASCHLQWETDSTDPQEIAAAIAKGIVTEIGKPFEAHEIETPQPRPLDPRDVGDE